MCHSPLQCVSRQLSTCCRSTVLAQVGGVCVVTAGPRSTRRRHANNWDTHSEFKPTEDEQTNVNLMAVLFQLKWRFASYPFYLDSKPHSTNVPVDTLINTLKTGPFTAVRPGTTTTPLHHATIDRWGNTSVIEVENQMFSTSQNIICHCCRGEKSVMFWKLCVLCVCATLLLYEGWQRHNCWQRANSPQN